MDYDMLIFIYVVALSVSCSVSFLGLICSKSNDGGDKLLFCYCFIASLIALAILVGTFNEPSAMDVYRGSTTLEITYRDSVPVDSVVVWKSNM